MRNPIIAVMLVTMLGALLYGIGYFLSLPAEIRGGLGGVPILFLRDLHELLERRTAQAAMRSNDPNAAILLTSHTLRPQTLILLGAVFTLGALLVIGGLSGLLLAIGLYAAGQGQLAHAPSIYMVTVFTAMPLKMLAASYVGRWIGLRSAARPYLLASASILLGLLIGFVLTMLFLQDLLREANMWIDASTNFLTMLPDYVLYLLAVNFGVWRGMRGRDGNQLNLTLKMLPESTRYSIIQLATDEAAAHAAGSR